MKVASLWRRFLAGLINVGALLPLSGAAGILIFGWFSHGSDSDDDSNESELPERVNRIMKRQKSVFWVMGVISAITGRNNRSVGAEVMRIRRVDARTGGPVTVRSALIRHTVNHAWTLLGSKIMRSLVTRTLASSASIDTEWKAIEHQHADPVAREEAVTALLGTRGVKPPRSCWFTLAGLFAPHIVTVLSPTRQSIPDRLAGIITVVED